MVNAGSGIGRYLAFGLGSDAVLDANGDLNALDGYGGFVAWRHVFSPKLRSNLLYSRGAFRQRHGPHRLRRHRARAILHANLIYSPFPKLDIGAELIFGQRALEDDARGRPAPPAHHVKYSF